ncbi:efflux transporter outer membrane subunit [Pseudomonas sp. ICMP22404]|uniref:efflux transporter outer membrane subunit n=1 Tax=Pseudomonas sp. ICMP22404 TaxID=2583807 RepID=UPI001118D9DE|nr:efflux transporter outer membrane subunit [Pseudomonas sp. ICMP22404]TNF84175.1 efflux transporter outer membrane subunit [Pseudomonas sp. ICMP22404]
MHAFKPRENLLLATLCATLLSGCVLGPDYRVPAVPVATQWQAPLPHGASVAALADWWQQFDDPALAELLRLAEADSPSMDQAWANIALARATADSDAADAMPRVDGRLSKGRGGQQTGTQRLGGSGASAELDAAWEIDLFGKLRRNNEAARSRVEARVDDWHDARVSLAAQVGDYYVQYRGCQKLVLAYRDQAQSQQDTARITRQSFSAGFTSSADAALADASAASSAAALVQQQSECEVLLKSLVALTGGDEERLIGVLGKTPAQLPEPAGLNVLQIPADMLRQRPDVASSERELAAANAEIGVAQADRLPSLSLSGTFSVGNTVGQHNRSWSLGPVLSVPLLDGGKRRAAVDGARASYDAALAVYRQTLRTSVMEVEQALVRLDAARRRESDVERSTAGFRESFEAIDRNWQAGSVSLLDRETARRQALTAEIELITLQQDQVRYWIALYKALGGGWQASQPLARHPTSNGEGV